MSDFEVLVRRIDDVVDHPNADRLSIVKILGYEAITNKLEDGSPRFAKGDLIVYVPEAAIIPEHLLKQYGYWDASKDDGAGRGMLAGKRGDRVKPVKLRGIFSNGLIWPVHTDLGDRPYVEISHVDHATTQFINEGDDVAEFFGIIKYEPPIPSGMNGEVAAIHEFAFGYDIESWQNHPDFLKNDEVEACLKIHGTHSRISYRPNVIHEEMFGEGDVGIASKGLGSKGLVFKNNEKNLTSNLYVRIAIEHDLISKVRLLGIEVGAAVDLFGEVFGPGVQWLHYGLKHPSYRAFDIAIGGVFLGADEKAAIFKRLGVERAPVVYRGPWNEQALINVRDGKSGMGGDHIREGIVVTSTGNQNKRETNGHRLRPILKMISPAYALKQTGEEIQ
jgi:RNA ligase (TIGR02306 family)